MKDVSQSLSLDLGRDLGNFCRFISSNHDHPRLGRVSMSRSVKWLSPSPKPSLVFPQWRDVLVAKITFHKTAPLDGSLAPSHFDAKSAQGPKSEFAVNKVL